MFTFIFERNARPVHFIQANDRREALKKLRRIMGYEKNWNWSSSNKEIRVIETKYVGIKVHIGDNKEELVI